jgi:hypothetical protein
MAETDQERSGKEVVEEDVEAGGEIDPEANEKREDPEKPGTSERRLSIFIFLATLVGSLLGAAADLSDARGLVLPILQIVNPVRQVRVVGSNTVLGEEIGLAAAWFANSTEFPSYVTPCQNNTTCLNAVLNKPGSLYWVSTAWLRTQPPRYLRPILVWYGESLETPLPPRCATVESPTCFETNKYHPDLVRPLYINLGGDMAHFFERQAPVVENVAVAV